MGGRDVNPICFSLPGCDRGANHTLKFERYSESSFTYWIQFGCGRCEARMHIIVYIIRVDPKYSTVMRG